MNMLIKIVSLVFCAILALSVIVCEENSVVYKNGDEDDEDENYSIHSTMANKDKSMKIVRLPIWLPSPYCKWPEQLINCIRTSHSGIVIDGRRVKLITNLPEWPKLVDNLPKREIDPYRNMFLGVRG